MSNSSLEQHLKLIEKSFNELSVALLDADALALMSCSAALQALAVELIQMADDAGREMLAQKHIAKRIKVLSASMPVLRESLQRRLSVIQRSLQMVVPVPAESTYGADNAISTNGPYGCGPRQSGAFRFLSA